ncbi:MAG: hypothetical protein H6Q26_281 [Bacteroidetes bacterium]|nr:hypothetical protein [Bacteroidota bacterium]
MHEIGNSPTGNENHFQRKMSALQAGIFVHKKKSLHKTNECVNLVSVTKV